MTYLILREKRCSLIHKFTVHRQHIPGITVAINCYSSCTIHQRRTARWAGYRVFGSKGHPCRNCDVAAEIDARRKADSSSGRCFFNWSLPAPIIWVDFNRGNNRYKSQQKGMPHNGITPPEYFKKFLPLNLHHSHHYPTNTYVLYEYKCMCICIDACVWMQCTGI